MLYWFVWQHTGICSPFDVWNRVYMTPSSTYPSLMAAYWHTAKPSSPPLNPSTFNQNLYVAWNTFQGLRIYLVQHSHLEL